MTQSTVINSFDGNSSEQPVAEFQVIQEARAQVEAEMQAELTAQARERLNEQARLLAESRASAEMALATQLKIQHEEDAKLAAIAHENLQTAERMMDEIQEKLAAERKFQAENLAKVDAEQQAKSAILQRLKYEQEARLAAEEVIKTERELTELKGREWQSKVKAQQEAENKLRALHKEISELEESTYRMSAELNAAEQTRATYAEKKSSLESRLNGVVGRSNNTDSEYVEPIISKVVEGNQGFSQSYAATRINQLIARVPTIDVDAIAFNEDEARRIASLEIELAALVRVAADRVIAQFSMQRKIVEAQIKLDAEMLERNAKLEIDAIRTYAIEARAMLCAETERKLKAEQDEAALLLSKASAERSAALLKEQTNDSLMKAELVIRQRIEQEQVVHHNVQLNLQAERELALTVEQHAAAEVELLRETEFKLQAEKKQLMIVNERIALEKKARLAVEQNIETEASALDEVEACVAAELRAIELVSQRLEIESRSRLLTEEAEKLNQQALYAAKEREKAAEHALQLARAHADMASLSLKAEQENIEAGLLEQRQFNEVQSEPVPCFQPVGEDKLAAMQRVQQLIDVLRRPLQNIDKEDEAERYMPKFELEKITEQERLEAEHHLLNKCWNKSRQLH